MAIYTYCRAGMVKFFIESCQVEDVLIILLPHDS